MGPGHADVTPVYIVELWGPCWDLRFDPQSQTCRNGLFGKRKP